MSEREAWGSNLFGIGELNLISLIINLVWYELKCRQVLHTYVTR